MRTLLIDNYDSFTYNLYQLLSVVNGTEPTVLRNDEVSDVALDFFDNVVISPGPGHPGKPRDFGISADIIARSAIPLLGVCLGHQGIVINEGGTVSPAPEPRHGYLEQIEHDGRDLFVGIPQQFTVVRYHSLAADVPLPDSLEATAWAPDGVVMALRHRSRPQWGVQFHPESVATEFGVALLRNFADLTDAQRKSRPRLVVDATGPRTPVAARSGTYRLNVDVLDRAVDTEAAFLRLYAAAPQSFWLDSEHVEPGLDRFSFLGDATGPLAETISFNIGDDLPGDIFDYLSTQLRSRAVDSGDLPFDFACGYVGYFGYELKHLCGSPARHTAETPDAQWIFADRMVAVDHQDGKTYLLALDDGGEAGPAGAAAARSWFASTRESLSAVAAWSNPADLVRTVDPSTVEKLLTRDRARYLADVATCQKLLRAGESYEICITDNARIDATSDGLTFYRTLRRCNPAPYAAYLRLGACEVACASPERFLKIDRRRMVESKPIKGTSHRGATPQEDEILRAALQSSTKTRAENLMIVDLLRNDLGKVCEVGSVDVPKLMATETYTTLHQLVSTVRGTLRADRDVIDCIRACFPGGSMTGAPKLRTMEIIDTLETEARGIYSGAIGFLGLNGTADLNIVIRSAVLTDGEWRVGAGGAVVLESDPEDEYQEMVLKAAATLRAHNRYAPTDAAAGP
jgi:para-aminobenzoate synthetase